MVKYSVSLCNPSKKKGGARLDNINLISELIPQGECESEANYYYRSLYVECQK